MAKKDKSRNFRIKNISTNSNSHFRNINQHTKMKIISELAMQILSFREIADKYNVSITAVKKINEENQEEILRLINSSDDNFDKIVKSTNINANYTSIINVAQFKKDENINKQATDDEEEILNSKETNNMDNLNKDSKNSTEIVNIDSINDSIKSVEDSNNIKLSSNKRAKITEEMINNIINDLKLQCYTQRQISERYGISTSSVNRIKKKYEFKLVDAVEESLPANNPNTIIISDDINPADEKIDSQNINRPVLEVTKNLDNDTIDSDTTEESQESDIDIINEEKETAATTTEEITHIDDLISIPSKNDNSKLDEKSMRIISNESILRARKKLVKDIKIGMIRNRHRMPINSFIFDDIDKYLIDDYQRQYEIAYERINQLMSTTNKSNTILSVYVTGLTSALASIIKACDDLQVNLTLLHYNPVKSSYLPQKIFNFTIDEEVDTLPYELQDIQYRNIYTYKCDPYHFVNLPYGFTILEYVSNIEDYANIRNKDLTLFTNIDDAWEYYIAACENAPIDDYNIIFNKVHLIGNRLYVLKTISSMKGNSTIYKI